MKKLLNYIKSMPRNIKWWYKNKHLKKLKGNDGKVAKALYKLAKNDAEYFKQLLELADKYYHSDINTLQKNPIKQDNATLIEEIINFTNKIENEKKEELEKYRNEWNKEELEKYRNDWKKIVEDKENENKH